MWDQYNKCDWRPALMGIKRIHSEVCRRCLLPPGCGVEDAKTSTGTGEMCMEDQVGFSEFGNSSRIELGVPVSDFGTSILLERIDGALEDGYSQAQIPDLVAHAIPRFLQSAQSSGILLLWALKPSTSIRCSPAVAKHFASSGGYFASKYMAAGFAPKSALKARRRATSGCVRFNINRHMGGH